jgi:hypothetical protein
MPLFWIIDSRSELVSAVAEGDVPLADAMAFLRTLSARRSPAIASCSTAAPARRQ